MKYVINKKRSKKCTFWTLPTSCQDTVQYVPQLTISITVKIKSGEFWSCWTTYTRRSIDSMMQRIMLRLDTTRNVHSHKSSLAHFLRWHTKQQKKHLTNNELLSYQKICNIFIVESASMINPGQLYISHCCFAGVKQSAHVCSDCTFTDQWSHSNVSLTHCHAEQTSMTTKST